MTTRITILGAGSGGYTAAIRAAHLGAEVTVIENDNLGGTCLNWGCIPTKTLRASAEALVAARRLSEFGIHAEGGFSPDMQAIMARKNKVVKILVGGIAALFKKNKIRLIKGRGTVLSPSRVQVETHDNGLIEVEGDKLILATGSKVMVIGIHADNATFDTIDLVRRQKSIIGVYGYDKNTFRRCLSLMSSGKVDLSPIITHRFPFSQGKEGFELASNKSAAKVVFVPEG